MLDSSRSAGARAREIGAKLRLRTAQGRDEAQAVFRRVIGELAGLADRAAAEANSVGAAAGSSRRQICVG
jgi:transposase, IS5 family